MNVAGSTITAGASGAFVVGSQTLTPGGTAVVSGTTMSLVPGGSVVVVNGKTSTLAASTGYTGPMVTRAGSKLWISGFGVGAVGLIALML